MKYAPSRTWSFGQLYWMASKKKTIKHQLNNNSKNMLPKNLALMNKRFNERTNERTDEHLKTPATIWWMDKKFSHQSLLDENRKSFVQFDFTHWPKFIGNFRISIRFSFGLKKKKFPLKFGQFIESKEQCWADYFFPPNIVAWIF